MRLDDVHVEETCRLLSQAFPDSALSQIGARLPRTFVRSFVQRADSSSFVAVDKGPVVGFLLGSRSAASHRRDFMRHCWPAVLLDLPRAVFRSPALASRVADRGLRRAIRHRANPARQSTTLLPDASLILMAVDPNCRGRGAARDLVTTFLNELAWRSVPAVKLAVDADNSPATQLDRSLGWEIARSYSLTSAGPGSPDPPRTWNGLLLSFDILKPTATPAKAT